MRTQSIKRWLVALFLPLATVSAFGYDAEIDGIYYNFSGDKASVTYQFFNGGNDYSGDVVIPSSVMYDGKSFTVTSIGYHAFSNSAGLTSVTIPESVTSIGEFAFSYCSGPTSITIPTKVTTIGQYAFYRCSGLTSIIIPESVTTIGGDAFSGCTSLISVTFLGSVSSISGGIFYRCEALKEIHLYKPFQCPDLDGTNGARLFIHSGDARDYFEKGWDRFTRGVLMSGSLSYEQTLLLYEQEKANVARLELIATETDFVSLRQFLEAIFVRLNDSADSIASLLPGNLYLTEEIEGLKSYATESIGGMKAESVDIFSEANAIEARLFENRYYLNSFFDEVDTLNWDLLSSELEDSLRAVYESTGDEEIGMQFVEVVKAMDTYAECIANGIRSIDMTTVLKMVEENWAYNVNEFTDKCGYLLTDELPSIFERIEDYLAYENPQQLDGIRYQLMADTTATVVGYDGDDTQVVIRDSIAFDGLMFPVKKIGRGAFKGLNITSVDIPETVEEIEDEAFADCYLLVTIICRHKNFAPIIYANTFRGCGTHSSGYGGSGYGFTVYVYSDTYRYFTENGHWKKIVTITYYWSCYFTGYATVYTTIADLQIPDGITAYTGVIRGDRVMLTEIEDKIPAGTPAIIYGRGGTYKFNFTTGAEPVGENDLKGTDAPLVADGTQYILYEEDRYGFFKATPGTTIPAGKAYIEYSGAGVKGFYFGDEATGFSELDNCEIVKSSNCQIFNLAGQRIQKIQEGINIVNGKKILK